MPAYLEHANLTVANIDAAVRFITTALPEWKVRGSGTGDGKKWLHVGTGTSYLALEEQARDAANRPHPYHDAGLNHLAFVVDDAEAVRKRLEGAGYREGFVPAKHPHRIRIYYFDGAGLEWEFVQYLSNDPAKRNDYSQ